MGRSESLLNDYTQKLEYRLATFQLQHRYDMAWYEFPPEHRDWLIVNEIGYLRERFDNGEF